MFLYNTLTRKIEKFEPINPTAVTLYTCGPTVYDFPHIGNIRSFTSNDFLKRTLIYFGYQVKHIMNITDVGHLTGDNDDTGNDDTGEDKMEKGAKRTGKTVWEVAKFYTEHFYKMVDLMNILKPDLYCKATDNVPIMIEFIKVLEKKGHTYETPQAIYFDIAKFKDYGVLSPQKLDDKLQGARKDVQIDTGKKHPTDFALWFKCVGRFKDHTMRWNSPWGEGFPGWHIECSAMSIKYLGETIDIHTGGIEHIPVHHENEIAQSEAYTGKPFVRYWFHNNHLQVDEKKMSKSLNNFYTIEDIIKKGIDPMALRLLFLQTHYRSQMNFTWDSAKAGQEAYNNLKDYVITLKKHGQGTTLSQEKLDKVDIFRQQFNQAIGNDLQTPQAVAVMWSMLKSNIPSPDKLDLLYDFDEVFGLKLRELVEEKIPDEIIKLADERFKDRKAGNFQKADKLRQQIESKGYYTIDTNESYQIKKI